MAVSQKVVCDKCGSEVVSDRTVIKIETGPLRDRFPTLDVCRVCVDQLLVWFTALTAPQEVH